MKYRVSYIGNYYKVPEMILQNENMEIVSVICESSKINDDLITFSLVRQIKLHEIYTKEDLKERIQEQGVDFFFMCSFGQRIPMEKLNGIKIFNIHYSLLPNYKGRHPTYWATVSGEKKVGISIHLITSKIDEGPIISQRSIPYYLWMSEVELFEKLTEEIPILLENTINYLKNKIAVINNNSDNYYPIVKEESYTIHIDIDSFEEIYNKVRAQSRYRGAKIELNGKICWLKNIKFTNLTLKDEKYLVKDGVLLIKCDNKICIKTTDFEFEVVTK